MKKTICILIVVSLVAASCNKTANVFSIATWSVASHNYAASTVEVQNSNQILAADSVNTMKVFFSSLPTASGTYTVVNMSKVTSHTLGANELAVQYTVGRTDTFSSIGGGSGVSVLLTGSLISFVLPTMSVEHKVGTSVIDTTTAGGTIEQH